MTFKKDIELEKYEIVGEVMYTEFAGVDSSIIEIADSNGDKATLVYKGNLTEEVLEFGEIVVKSGKMTHSSKDKMIVVVDSIYDANEELTDAIDASNQGSYDFNKYVEEMENTKSKKEILTLLYGKKLKEFIDNITELSSIIYGKDDNHYYKEIKVLETAYMKFSKKKITSAQLEESIDESMLSSYLDKNGKEINPYDSHSEGHLNYDLNTNPYAQKILEKGSLHIISDALVECEVELNISKKSKTTKKSTTNIKKH